MKIYTPLTIVFFGFYFCILCFSLVGQNFNNLISPEARIVLLGDPSHGEGNVFEYRAELIQKLHDDYGFNTIGIESGVYFLNNVSNDLGNYNTDYLRQNIFSIYSQAQQFQNTLNAVVENKLSFFGFDFQYSSNDKELKSLFTPDLFNHLSCEEKVKLFQFLEYCQLDRTLNDSLFTDLQPILVKVKEYLVKTYSPDSSNQFHYLNNLIGLNRWKLSIGYDEMNEESWNANMSNYRDSVMAANVLWWLNKYPESKVILVGASGHFAKNLYSFDHEELSGFVPMGKRLSDTLKDQLVSIATISGGGEYGAYFEQPTKIFLDSIADERQFVDSEKDSVYFLSTSSLMDSTCFSTAIDYSNFCGNWKEAFDGFFVFNNYSAVDNVSRFESAKILTITDVVSGSPLSGVSIQTALGDLYYTVSDSSGKFYSLPEVFYNSMIEIYKDGYYIENTSLSERNDTLFLMSKSDRLGQLNDVNVGEVSVVGKRNEAKDIFKSALRAKVKNYATISASQVIDIQNRIVQSSDAVVLNRVELLTTYPRGYLDQEYEEVILKVDSFNCIEDASSNFKSGSKQEVLCDNSAQSWTLKVDALKGAPIFQDFRKGKKFKFDIVNVVEDTIVIGFEARKLKSKITGYQNVKSYKGKVKVLRGNRAIVDVSIEIIFETKADFQGHFFKNDESDSEHIQKIVLNTKYEFSEREVLYVPYSAIQTCNF
jgi:erythromycin esterase-like protein